MTIRITTVLPLCLAISFYAHSQQTPAPGTPDSGKASTTEKPAPAEQPQGPGTSTQPTLPMPPDHHTPVQVKRIAWGILASACRGDNVTDRASAVRVLGLLPDNAEARKLALRALKDDKAEVRAAAATALGEMRDRKSIPELQHALDDDDPSVALAAAHSLVLMHDKYGYEIYYEVLTGQRKTGKGFIASELSTLKDKKKLAMLGFEQGIGFVPFAGIGWGAFQEIRKEDSSSAPVRVAAAKMLVHDPDPASTRALVDATSDKNWLVRVAALESLARRGDRSSLNDVEASLNDDKSAVRFTAAAATLHLMAAHRRHLPAKWEEADSQ
ncbi:MAG TPA: HEAT repeat domain-containing protein [Terriglobales bacterium]|nr:HEAT repeat domain-containing protein [Terriglobales bacterium]